MLTQNQLKQTFKIRIDEDNFLYLTFIKRVIGKAEVVALAQMIKDEISGIFSPHPDTNFKICKDLTHLKQNDQHVPRQARELYVSLMKHQQVERVAVIGQNVMYKVIINFFSVAAGLKNRYKWCVDEHEALAWLNIK